MTLTVLRTGLMTTIEDLGRPGYADLGVSGSGAADQSALRLANRILGNPEGLAGLEVTLGGLEVTSDRPILVAITGAPAPAWVDGRPVALLMPVRIPAGATLRLGTPEIGLRTYVAVRGGIDVPPVLGSRSTDILSGLGPAVVTPGTRLPIGTPPGTVPGDASTAAPAGGGDVVVRAVATSRQNWFSDDAPLVLARSHWVVSSNSDRVGVRLTGPQLPRSHDDELASEPVIRGSIEVPPSGQPLILLADHPVTGGYPVIAVVIESDVDRIAQLRPGQGLRIELLPVASVPTRDTASASRSRTAPASATGDTSSRPIRVERYGDRALLVETPDAGLLRKQYAALVAANHEGVAEIVPAARTLLIRAHHDVDLERLAAAVHDTPPTAAAPLSGDEIEIKVRYNGADLNEVAELNQMTRAELIAAHTREQWTAAFCGFAPGFAYLVAQRTPLIARRRSTPRTRVPAGAVALAGPYTGIYPRPSPGGWQLIGETDQQIWNLAADPPALLRPGVRVRFTATDD